MPGFPHRIGEPVEANLSADGSMGYLIERTRVRDETGPDWQPDRHSTCAEVDGV
jgi:hypothetical protein